jgi:uncharacterized protein YndB with AHSA1/START domain/predicted XRE-type DNA-binding protein
MVEDTATRRPKGAHQPPPIRISRAFSVPRAALFSAWSSADQIKRWFGPATYTVTDATVQLRVGGPFVVRLRGSYGAERLIRGVFVEVIPNERLAIDMAVADAEGRRLFEALTEVTFADDSIGARMDLGQKYALVDPAMAAPMVWGASEGWRTALDKLEAEVTRTCANERGAPEDSQAEAASATMRSDLMIAIGERVKSWGMAQTEAACRLGVTRPRLDDLLHGRIQNFNLDALVDLAARAGLRVRLDIAA